MAEAPEARNELEQRLIALYNEEIQTIEFLQSLVNAEVFVLCDNPVDDGDTDPSQTHMVFVTDPENKDQTMLAVFTDRDRALAFEQAPGYEHPSKVDLKWVTFCAKHEFGAMLNPNSGMAYRIPPEAVSLLQEAIDEHIKKFQDYQAGDA